jgi:hypothetical protein
MLTIAARGRSVEINRLSYGLIPAQEIIIGDLSLDVSSGEQRSNNHKKPILSNQPKDLTGEERV